MSSNLPPVPDTPVHDGKQGDLFSPDEEEVAPIVGRSDNIVKRNLKPHMSLGSAGSLDGDPV